MKLEQADALLKSAYLDLVKEAVRGKTTKRTKIITCGLCGRHDVTLHKLASGVYICTNCKKEQENG